MPSPQQQVCRHRQRERIGLAAALGQQLAMPGDPPSSSATMWYQLFTGSAVTVGDE